MHTFLTQSKFNQIPCTCVFEVTLPMCLLFYHYIKQSCSEVVATLFIHVINQIMNGCRLTESVLYFIQYATLIYNSSIKVSSVDVYFLFDSYLYSNKITLIKSDQFKNIAKLYRLWIFLLFVFFYSMIYNTCVHVFTMYVA